MDQTLLLLLFLLVAAAACVDVAATGATSWPVALAAYSLWALASLALAVLLPRRRRPE
ncbi:hypothetical protein GQ55_1G047200 [Panicum hallii var. hallii]|uniref:Uncharacterized protein n=1 Tax=Panicum hallii var. hallii TaxID=1504633 RepID=A0A2T7F2A5_9POAL|nr:hypothetical protein GQ55_1G047200 [Panicum hallii var. hallii]